MNMKRGKNILKERRRCGSDGIRGECPGPHGADETKLKIF